MVGVPASGKNYYADKMFEPIVRLCADDLRLIITGNESNQDRNHIVFEQLFNFARILLRQNKDIVIVNTNYDKKNRKNWVKLAKEFDAELEAVVMRTSLEICLRRNSSRERKVPESVIIKQFEYFEEPTEEEGFSRIHNIIYKGDLS